MWCKSQDTEFTERQLFIPGRGGLNIFGHCWAGIAFISSLLEGPFLNNGDVPGFENTAMGEEVLVGKSEDGCEILRWRKYFFFRSAE